jgi:hypothetical protein
LRGSQLIQARRVIERRRTQGRSIGGRMSSRKPNEDVTTSSLVRNYQREVERQKLLVKKAETAQRNLLFIVGALRQLLADENFTNLLRAEGLDTCRSTWRIASGRAGAEHDQATTGLHSGATPPATIGGPAVAQDTRRSGDIPQVQADHRVHRGRWPDRTLVGGQTRPIWPAHPARWPHTSGRAEAIGLRPGPCLVATDDESYTYNNRINRLSSIQEHLMIRRAVERGVTPERLAKALGRGHQPHHQEAEPARRDLPGSRRAAADSTFSANLGAVLRKMKPTRQVECVELMVSANNITVPTPRLWWPPRPATCWSARQAQEDDRRHRRSDGQDGARNGQPGKQFKLAEQSYGQDILNLVLAKGYLAKLLANEAIRALTQKHPDMLNEFGASSSHDAGQVNGQAPWTLRRRRIRGTSSADAQRLRGFMTNLRCGTTSQCATAPSRMPLRLDRRGRPRGQ